MARPAQGALARVRTALLPYEAGEQHRGRRQPDRGEHEAVVARGGVDGGGDSREARIEEPFPLRQVRFSFAFVAICDRLWRRGLDRRIGAARPCGAPRARVSGIATFTGVMARRSEGGLPATPRRAELDLVPTAMVAGGSALARDPEGRVVFVAGALPGERVRVAVETERRGYLTARVIDV